MMKDEAKPHFTVNQLLQGNFRLAPLHCICVQTQLTNWTLIIALQNVMQWKVLLYIYHPQTNQYCTTATHSRV